ncbi:MAG TPA: uroporphyrinogen-III synthase [Mycobacteriales bacterium]|nr:uroporphyrinogen-III synthase [Mycobacteriales bacterium]
MMTSNGDGDGDRAAALAGFTIAITADRRREELATLLERRGARIVQVPAVRIVPLADDAAVLAATQSCVDNHLDDVVVTTGIGFRSWLEAARSWDYAEPLLDRLAAARVLTRGPKATGAVRAAGLAEGWSAATETVEEMREYLAGQDLTGRRIAVQLHGGTLPEFCQALRAAGADVIEVPVYRWLPPADPEPLRRLVEQIANQQVDAVAFTSAPAVMNLLYQAERDGRHGALVEALRGPVLAACVGPVCAEPLGRLGVSSLQPDRGRIGSLARAITAALPHRAVRAIAAGHRLDVRGHAVLVDDEMVPVPPAPIAVLRALAQAPHRVHSRDELRRVVCRGSTVDDHAVEVAVARLRAALGDSSIVRTVVKRGYRLAPAAERETG